MPAVTVPTAVLLLGVGYLVGYVAGHEDGRRRQVARPLPQGSQRRRRPRQVDEDPPTDVTDPV